MFALVKRVGEKDENLASFFYSILLSTHSVMLFFPIRYIAPKGFFTPYSVLIKLSFGAIFFIWYFICKYYFLKKKNFIRVIATYEKKFLNINKRMAIIGITYSLVTFLSFYMTAVYLANGSLF